MSDPEDHPLIDDFTLLTAPWVTPRQRRRCERFLTASSEPDATFALRTLPIQSVHWHPDTSSMLFDTTVVTVTFTGHLIHARYNSELGSPPTYSVAVECMTTADHHALATIASLSPEPGKLLSVYFLPPTNTTPDLIPDHFLSTISMAIIHKPFVNVFDATHRIRPLRVSLPISFLTLTARDLVNVQATVTKDFKQGSLHFNLVAIHLLQRAPRQ
ncbi:hypothetical protein GSI_02771 [Ganoderma sinense ZZ0214-1]|uniref:Uncharacterized protein n=1 Tax=Ganoderma sinense ZZ0214-1 TaxID=1077348 RepID=A0A2G8SMI5_9APHY|nr:hypothetical protein GSI_02771 [Ganoderma sinense ZZ0214-1]